MFGRAISLLAATVLLGCTRIAGLGDTATVAAVPLQSSREVITKLEIGKTRGLTTYDVVARFRPEFLNPATSRDVAGVAWKPVVYVNGVLAGDVSALRQISADFVTKIRYVRPRDAVTRHGEASRGGEILVYMYGSPVEQP